MRASTRQVARDQVRTFGSVAAAFASDAGERRRWLEDMNRACEW